MMKKDELRIKLKNVELIECDTLLFGDPSWEEVQKFFLDEEFDDEKYLVQVNHTSSSH